jgi:hypothetical protein
MQHIIVFVYSAYREVPLFDTGETYDLTGDTVRDMHVKKIVSVSPDKPVCSCDEDAYLDKLRLV